MNDNHSFAENRGRDAVGLVAESAIFPPATCCGIAPRGLCEGHRYVLSLLVARCITVNGNWRLTFEFGDGHAHIVDYEDYH